jgi:H+/gluconate symporter-like permease
MLIAGIVLIFAIQGFGVVPFIFLLIAAALVFLDRRKKVTAQG